jgi:hypothetical protein
VAQLGLADLPLAVWKLLDDVETGRLSGNAAVAEAAQIVAARRQFQCHSRGTASP